MDGAPIILGGDGRALNPPPESVFPAPAILRNQTGPGGCTGWFSEDPGNDTLARDILNDLWQAYPNHRWFVRIDDGVIVIYNYAISGKWGMCTLLSDVVHDATKRRRDLQRAAGELLERAALRRRSADGEKARTIEIQKFGKSTVKAGLPI